MNLVDYARVIRRLWWVVLIGIAVGAAGGAGLALATPASYQVRTVAVVSVTTDGTAGSLQTGNVFAMQRAGTYARLATSRAVLDQVAQQIGAGVTLAELQNSVSATAVSDSGIIDINVSGHDPELVQQIANAVPDALAVEARQLDTPGIASPIHITSVDVASVPTTAYAPQPRFSTLVGAAVGLLAALGVIVALNVADGRIRSVSDLPNGLRFASRTILPARRRKSDEAARADALRRLRSNLRFGPGVASTIAVMPVALGAVERVAWPLADGLADAGARVLLIDADPGVVADPERFPAGIQGAGLAEVLSGEADLDQLLMPLGNGITYLAAGGAVGGTLQLFGNEMAVLLGQLKEHFEQIILRCPPILQASHAADLAAIAGGTVLVVEIASTTRTELLRAMDILAGVRADDVSLVVDGVREGDLRSAVSPVPAAAAAAAEQDFTS